MKKREAWWAALAAVSIVACGGSDTSDLDGDSASAPSGVDRHDGAGPRLEATTTWSRVADEWQTFTLAARATVRYGVGNTWLERQLEPGSHGCTNTAFGADPVPGFAKRCEVAQVTPDEAGSWVFATGEWGNLVLAAPRRVRYGAESSWLERDLLAGTYACTNTLFGQDPIVGKAKRCETWEGTASPGPSRWTTLAAEWATFTLSTPGVVRFGIAGAWVERSLPAGQATCRSDTFGSDPAIGRVKTCELREGSPPPPPPPPPAVLVGAGDIAGWGPSAEATAALLDAIPGTVFTLGDHAYPNGTAAEFTTYYQPTWGRHKARTYPTTGNHDYDSPAAKPYFDYFFAGNPTLASLDPSRRGYYSYDLGGWHIVVLDSIVGAAPSQAQIDWLRADLAARKTPCMLAYWHHPRFSSGAGHGNNANLNAFWQVLHAAGVDVVLNGHEHIYERFDPQSPSGVAEPNGIRAFIVGTGGAPAHAIGTVQPNSAVRISGTYGVLKLTLRPTGYDWDFVKVASQAGNPGDAGSSTCTNTR